jgi:hypothetical protein
LMLERLQLILECQLEVFLENSSACFSQAFSLKSPIVKIDV